MAVMKTGEDTPRPHLRQGRIPGPKIAACAVPHPAETLRTMWIAWTTVATRADAECLAADAVARGLALCVQIDGPVVSHYRWESRLERAEEFRLCLKCLPEQLDRLEKHLLAAHPYSTPEWLVTRADHVGEKYLSWAMANSTVTPFHTSQPPLSPPCLSTKASKAPPASSSNAMS